MTWDNALPTTLPPCWLALTAVPCCLQAVAWQLRLQDLHLLSAGQPRHVLVVHTLLQAVGWELRPGELGVPPPAAEPADAAAHAAGPPGGGDCPAAHDLQHRWVQEGALTSGVGRVEGVSLLQPGSAAVRACGQLFWRNVQLPTTSFLAQPAPKPTHLPLDAGVTIAATGSKDRTVRLWGLAPLLPSPVQKPGIATLRGHGAPITCLAMAGGGLDGSSSSGGGGGGGIAASGSWLLSGSLDARVKQWDAFHGSCVGTAKCGMPIAACQPLVAAPELQPHALLVSGGTQVQLLDLRCLRPVAGVAVPAERGEAVHCFCQWGWDLAVGSSDGARVFDMRQLPSLGSSSAAAASGVAAAGMGRAAAPERLRLVGHARPVSEEGLAWQAGRGRGAAH